MWREKDARPANGCDDFAPMLAQGCRIADNSINCDPQRTA
jgi:hypothetical protein